MTHVNKKQIYSVSAVPQSHGFMPIGQARECKRKNHTEATHYVKKDSKVRRRSMGDTTTRFRRRYSSTCLFSPDRLNRLGHSQSYATHPTSRTSGPVNGSTHNRRKRMAHNDRTIHRTTSVSTTNHQESVRRAIARRGLARANCDTAGSVVRTACSEVDG